MVYSSKKPTKKIKGKSLLAANFFIYSGVAMLLTAFLILEFPLAENLFGERLVLSQTTSTQTVLPISIQVPRVLPDVKIKPGHLRNDEWEIATNSANYLNQSGILGKSGNVVIYGHNTDQVFKKLLGAKKGDTIIITGTNGEKFNYKIETIKRVLPTDTKILSQDTPDQKITIFTCTGLFDSERLVLIGKRVT